jgi:preprotein translocase subunit SecE
MLGVRIPPALPNLFWIGYEAMTKGASDNSGNKAQAKRSGGFKNPLSRSSARTSVIRSGGAPRGAVFTKPAGRLLTFFREVKIELSKVTWPPRKELVTSTGVVILAVAIAGAYIGVFDFIWNIIVRSVGLG